MNDATHFLYANSVVLDSDTIIEGSDKQFGGELLLSATAIDGDTVPSGTRIEFLSESTERGTGERVFGVAIIEASP